MSYELSFSEEFYTDESFPYDTRSSDKATTLYQAIITLQDRDVETFRQACVEAGLVDSDISLDIIGHSETLPVELMTYAREQVNTCTDLSSPVEVWLDEGGYITVRVYDKE